MREDVSSPYLDMWKDWAPEVRIFEKDDDTRKWKPSTGMSITFRVSDTEQGPAIGTLTGLVTTEAPGDDGLGGIYVGGVDLATLTSQLPDDATYPHGTAVYLQVVKTGDIQVEAIRKVIRRVKY